MTGVVDVFNTVNTGFNTDVTLLVSWMYQCTCTESPSQLSYDAPLYNILRFGVSILLLEPCAILRAMPDFISRHQCHRDYLLPSACPRAERAMVMHALENESAENTSLSLSC